MLQGFATKGLRTLEDSPQLASGPERTGTVRKTTPRSRLLRWAQPFAILTLNRCVNGAGQGNSFRRPPKKGLRARAMMAAAHEQQQAPVSAARRHLLHYELAIDQALVGRVRI